MWPTATARGSTRMTSSHSPSNIRGVILPAAPRMDKDANSANERGTLRNRSRKHRKRKLDERLRLADPSGWDSLVSWAESDVMSGFSQLNFIFVGFSAPIDGGSSIHSSQLVCAGGSRHFKQNMARVRSSLHSLGNASDFPNSRTWQRLDPRTAIMGSMDPVFTSTRLAMYIAVALLSAWGSSFNFALNSQRLFLAVTGVSSRTLRLHHNGFRPVWNLCGSSRPPPGHPFSQVTEDVLLLP